MFREIAGNLWRLQLLVKKKEMEGEMKISRTDFKLECYVYINVVIYLLDLYYSISWKIPL